MNIEIRHRPPCRLWHMRLAEALRQRGHNVGLRTEGVSQPLSLIAGQLLKLQRRLFGPRPALFDPTDTPETALATKPDLVVLCDGSPWTGGDAIAPLFHGRTGDAALLTLCVSEEAPLEIVRYDTTGGQVTLVAALAVEDRQIAWRALDQILARLVSVLTHATELSAPRVSRSVAPRGPIAVESGLVRGMAAKVIDRMRGGARGPNHWRIAFSTEDQDEGGPNDWPPRGTCLLPDDGRRFYADPIPFEHNGRRYIFFEDYPYATAKGVIACVEIDEAGRAGSPRTVLEQPFHLSYPFLIRYGAEIYMLPEMGAAGRVQLFRADPFPDRWVPDCILLADCRAADATLVQHAGSWWMFATTHDDGGSTWDQLMIFHAPDLFGPWTPHQANPVLIDAGSARPAGPMWIENGVLMRVAQDCRSGYGRGLTICRVDVLDETRFEQTIVKRLGPCLEGADGTHTYARTRGLEVFDLRYPPGSSSRNGT